MQVNVAKREREILDLVCSSNQDFVFNIQVDTLGDITEECKQQEFILESGRWTSTEIQTRLRQMDWGDAISNHVIIYLVCICHVKYTAV